MKRAAVLTVLVVVAVFQTASAAVPRTMSYQGVLRQANGSLVADGQYEVIFRLYVTETGGTPAWAETLTVDVESGIFNVVLGKIQPLDLPFDEVYWLSIEVEGGGELGPRVELTASPYALRAMIADDGDWAIDGDDMYSGVPGSVGIGTSPGGAPNAKLDVAAGDALVALYGEGAFGAYFVADALGISVEVSPSGNGSGTGIIAVVEGPRTNCGVSGSGTGPWMNLGVAGEAEGGQINYGLYGEAGGGTSSDRSYGVYGESSGPGSNWAGYFAGDVHVTSSLTVGGAKSFKIDHPLDPANRYLYHYCIESDELANVYSGNVILDHSGEATVELPEWFEALNQDFRYQLTCVGGFAPVYIAEKISGNRFKIAGGEPRLEVSWQVTGIRHDRFAESHRIPVEEYKSDRERGKYLHPEAYGMPETMGVDYREEDERRP